MKLAAALAVFLCLYLLLPPLHTDAQTAYTDAQTVCHPDKPCNLPDCYCNYRDIPGNLTRTSTPQMILFTYTGSLSRHVRETINDLFANKVNPNDCPMGITLFVITQGTDLCGAYNMYYQGHEIALAGNNRTRINLNWTEASWSQQIEEQRFYLADEASISQLDMLGMRAQKTKPGGKPQYDMLDNNEYFYDSSILAGPMTDFNEPYYWPFTLDYYIHELKRQLDCFVETCPISNYPGLWEVPVSSMISKRSGKMRPCTYLDECVGGQGEDQVKDHLMKHFRHSYYKNRAPFMINLQARTLEFPSIVDGIKAFLKQTMAMQDTWVVTIQDALKWVQNPTEQSQVLETKFWQCAEREIHIPCKTVDERNSTTKRVSLRYVIDVDKIWIYQTVFLVVLYIALVRYDRDVTARKKRN